MTETNTYIGTDEEREEGHINTRERNFNARTKTRISDAIWG